MARPAPGADRSVAVLELLTDHPDERFTLSEVARRCDLNKATAHALLSALTGHGVLLRHPDEKRYSLGPRLLAIGAAARRGYSAVDFAPGLLARLAAPGLWARAFARVGDLVVQVAQAGTPSDVDAAAPVKLPLVPPVGAAWMAWADDPSVQAWLARAATVDVVRPTLDALRVTRGRGFAVTLSSPEWRRLFEPALADRLVVYGGDSDRDGWRTWLAAMERQPLLLGDIDDEVPYAVAEIAAPVFGISAEVELVVTVSVRGAELAGAALRVLGSQVARAADELTDAVRGRPPGLSASAV